MNINVGTKNNAKIEAVRDIIEEYQHLSGARVEGIEVSSGVANQPKSLDETMRGAMNRAKRAWINNCDYSIGLESGLMHVPMSKTGHMDVCACAIYDGEEFHFGLSSAWEVPDKKILDLILHDGLNLTQAVTKVGLTENPNIASGEGVISLFTKGRLNRREYTKQALRTALIHLEPKE